MIKEYTMNESEQWDKVVRSFKDYDIYYLSGYVKAFEQNGDGRAQLIYLEHMDTRAINVVIKRDISKSPMFAGKLGSGEWFDLTTPYGYGGFLIEGPDRKAILKEYEEYARKKHIVSEFVRFHPLVESWDGLDCFFDIIHLGNTVCIDTGSKETIWNNFSSKNRNVIRKAIKSDTKIYWCRDPHIISPFMEIYRSTMDKDHADAYYYFKEDFYESILNDLKDNAMWFYSVKDEIITAISIFMFCNGKMHYHLSASRREYQHLAPTNLLLYEAAMWACRNGYTRLHLGGGVGSSKDSLYAFKKAFNKNGRDTEFCIGKKVFNEEMYKLLVDIRKETDSDILAAGYFPAYRFWGVISRKIRGNNAETDGIVIAYIKSGTVEPAECPLLQDCKEAA